MVKGLRYFSQENIQVATMYMKSYSISLIIREIQIKITMRYHFSHVKMTIIKQTNNKI